MKYGGMLYIYIIIVLLHLLKLKKNTMLEIEFEYYLANQNELVEKYNGKFIVIKGKSVIGVYNSHSEAYNETQKTEVLGTFLIQHCLPGTDAYSQTFHSQVIIYNLA